MDARSIDSAVLRVSSILTALSLPHHLTGGLVASYYGEPRYTMDIDFAVSLPLGHRNLPALIDALVETFDIDLESSQESLRSHGMFQALDKLSAYKIDFHSRELVPGELLRSVNVEIFEGVTVPIASLEDFIMSKLIWWTMGSEKSWKDAVSALRVQKSTSVSMLKSLAQQLDLSSELTRLLEAAGL